MTRRRGDVCTTCRATRPRRARWFYLYADADASASAGSTLVAAYCRTCVPVGVYASSLAARTHHLVQVYPPVVLQGVV